MGQAKLFLSLAIKRPYRLTALGPPIKFVLYTWDLEGSD